VEEKIECLGAVLWGARRRVEISELNEELTGGWESLIMSITYLAPVKLAYSLRRLVSGAPPVVALTRL
jgi:hypothetical protein